MMSERVHYIDPEHTRVLITGATSGVGEATAKLFAARGAAAVALLGRRPEELSRVADEIGDRAHTFRADVSDSVSATDAVRAAVEGIDTNLSGMFYVSREAGLRMRAAGRGAIVNVASDLASIWVAVLAHYSAAKAGVVGLSRALAIELAPTVRVNVVSPGPVDTPMLRGGLDASAPRRRCARRRPPCRSNDSHIPTRSRGRSGSWRSTGPSRPAPAWPSTVAPPPPDPHPHPRRPASARIIPYQAPLKEHDTHVRPDQ